MTAPKRCVSSNASGADLQTTMMSMSPDRAQFAKRPPARERAADPRRRVADPAQPDARAYGDSSEPGRGRRAWNTATYRVLFVRPDGRAYVAHAGLESRTAAERAASAAAQSDHSNSRCAKIVLQRGTPAPHVAYDAARVIPGIRGGWSDNAWETIDCWRAGNHEASRDALAVAPAFPAPSSVPATSSTTTKHATAPVDCDVPRRPAVRRSYERWRWKVWGCVALAVTAWFITLAYLSR